MADVPKPLPRTRIGVKPVRVLKDQGTDLSHEVPHTENTFVETQSQNISKNQSVTVIQIEEETSPHLITSNNEGNTPPVEVENLREKTYEGTEFIIEKEVHDELKSECTSSSTNKEDEENLSTAPNVSDSSSKEIEVIEDDDDNDDVIDEILKYKKSAISQKTSRKDGIRSAEKNEISSLNGVEKKDLDSANDTTEDLLGIHIHRSDCLKMEHIIRHPSVMVHIVDSNKDGVYLQKSKPDKNVTYNQEHSSSILPVMTRPFNFKDNKCIIPEWEETLTFNETTSYIIKPSTIFFFEIVDFVDSSHLDDEYATIGWRRIAWAFLKPLGSNNTLNVGKMLRLQLYEAVPKSSNVPSVSVPFVYQWYKKKRFQPYPSTLYVTVENISYNNVDSKPQQRSCTPFQPEVGSDASVKSLAIFSSDGEELADIRDNSSAIYRLGDIEWSRLPGQSCKIPNSKISTLHPDSRGCLATKFSNSGIFLACGTSNEVFVYAIDGVIEKRFSGHQGLIYTLCWFTDDSLLLSASADCTACIWDTKSSNLNPIQILPHPSFVYCSTFLYPERVIVTGSYDGMLRIWYQTHASSKVWQLHQELRGHEGFVNALCSYRNKEFFSGDSAGVIIHWGFDECGRWSIINEIRLPEIQGIIINKLSLFPGDKRLLIHTRDSLLRTIDLKTAVTIQWYQGGLNDSFQCNSVITTCGSLIFSTSEDGTVNVWESNTGKQVAFYSGNFASGCGGTVDFHPYDHIAVFSFYSSKSSSSSVYLLKYSANAMNDIDITLYLLNESSRQSQKIDNLSASSVSGEENDSNYGKSTTKKRRFQPFWH